MQQQQHEQPVYEYHFADVRVRRTPSSLALSALVCILPIPFIGRPSWADPSTDTTFFMNADSRISYNKLSVCRSSWFSKAAWTVACAKTNCEKWCAIANRVSSSPSENISTAFSLPPQLILNHSITLQNPRYTTSHPDKRILYWKTYIFDVYRRPVGKTVPSVDGGILLDFGKFFATWTLMSQ